jgi:response regulator RpfG family c-di-GMP phosphodiesterase
MPGRLGLPRGKGREIPVAAHIVKIADVFDSLISRRVYKEAWEEKEVIDYLKWQTGKQFDPDLVEIFLDMQDIVASIRKKYSY